MGEPQKTSNIVNIQRQLDNTFPNRVKPDGWVGDAAHRTHTSGHNPDDTPGSKPSWDGDPDNIPEVRALDVAKDLGNGYDGQDLVNHLIGLPGLSTVIRYMIYNGFIYHMNNGYLPVPFDGDPHRDHVHIECAWSQSADNNSTYNFRLDDITMPTVDDIWNKDVDPTASHYTAKGALVDSARRTDSLANDQVPSLSRRVDALSTAVADLAKVVAEIKTAVTSPK